MKHIREEQIKLKKNMETIAGKKTLFHTNEAHRVVFDHQILIMTEKMEGKIPKIITFRIKACCVSNK